MLWLAFVVHFIHVFLAIFWFGATLAMYAIVAPALRASSQTAAGEVGKRLGPIIVRVLAPVGGLTILFGIVSATVFGPVKTLAFLWSSWYGRTVAIAFVLSVVVAAIGARTGRLGVSLAAATEQERPEILRRLEGSQVASLWGFAAILVCMLLMRWGIP